MIQPKTPQEIISMREGGKRLGAILDCLIDIAKPGVTLQAIEDKAMEEIKKSGGIPSFTTVGDYKWATCLCVNDEVVHGIPTSRMLKNGDILTIDVGMIYEGLHTDTAYTQYISDIPSSIPHDVKSFLLTGKKTLDLALALAVDGNHIGDISSVIQHEIESAGYHVVKTLVGHGVGKVLHEEPQIPGFLKTHVANTPILIAGQTIAIEIIYGMGTGSIVYANDDGWTISTRDGSLSAVFEHSVLVGATSPEILTARVKHV
jgi:methionyl aminopeptidase